MNLGENPILTEEVESDNELKTWLVDYVGNKLEASDESSQLEGGQVTVEHIIGIMSLEFPEFLMAVAEENWVRGYHQALVDIEDGEKVLKEHKEQEKEEGDLESCGEYECEEDG